MQLSVRRFPEPRRPHLAQGVSPGASHSSLPGLQGPLVPLPAWSPWRGKAAGASGRIPESTVPGLRGPANLCLWPGFPFLICESGMWPSLPNFQPSHPTFWASCGDSAFHTLFDCSSRAVGGHMTQTSQSDSLVGNRKFKGNQC